MGGIVKRFIESGLESAWAWDHRGRVEKEKVTKACFATAGEFMITFCLAPLAQSAISSTHTLYLCRHKSLLRTATPDAILAMQLFYAPNKMSSLDFCGIFRLL